MKARSDFAREVDVIERVIDRSARLPQQVFRTTVCSLHVIEFDVLLSEEFFANVQGLTVATDATAFTFGVLEPDPETYYHAHFESYPFVRCTPSDTAKDYINALHRDPGGSPADAIAYHSDVVVVYPEGARWMIYGDRTFEIAIVTTTDESAAALVATHPPARMFTMSETLAQLLPPVFGGVVPMAVHAALLENYSGR